MADERKLVLASGSPRRVELMREAGYAFDMVVPEVEEAHDPALSCEQLTMENARLKAVAGLELRPGSLVIGADTLVYVDGHPLGKPKDLDDARAMLRRLSGRVHQVCTGVALASPEHVETFAVITHVTFKPLNDSDIEAYLEKVHVLDKAGSYAVQECGEMIVHHVDGSLTNVVGLPMEELNKRLEALK